MSLSKTIQRDKDDAMLHNFLNHWQIETLHRMNLRDYNHTGDKNTFCQDVETKTRPLGSIKGNSSAKFGIYRQAKYREPPATDNLQRPLYLGNKIQCRRP